MIEITNNKNFSGEPVADLLVGHSSLSGIKTSAAITPRLIDEFPILFIAAALAKGNSEFHGLRELQFKESDRLKEMARGLTANGVEVEEFSDGLKIKGLDGMVPGGELNIDELIYPRNLWIMLLKSYPHARMPLSNRHFFILPIFWAIF